MLNVASWIAIVFGGVLAALELLRNWGHWEWWPFWVVDFVAAALLVAGGLLALRGRSTHVLAGGWGFACAMFWMSFFSHLEGQLHGGAAGDSRERLLTQVIGALFALTLAGFALALAARRRAP